MLRRWGGVLIVHRLAQGGHRYYLESVGLGEEPGRWLGSDAVLTGPDLRDALPSGRGRVPGFDLTFAAPKSVSVLHGVGRVDAVAAAHDRAVNAAMGYLSEHACVVRAQGRPVRADGFTAAGFRHRVSRSDDPHLHTHVVVANRATVNGREYALLTPLLYAERRAAGAVYQLVLRHEMSAALGVEWGPRVRGCADVVDVPPVVCRAFSQRSRQIRGVDAPRRFAERVTRQPREHPIAIDTLRTQWAERAQRLGWACPPLSVRALSPPTLPDVVPPADRWTRTDVLVALADRWGNGASSDHIRAAMDAVIARADVVRLGPVFGPGQAAERFTTTAALQRRADVSARLAQAPRVDVHHPGRTVVAVDRAEAEQVSARSGVVAVPADAVGRLHADTPLTFLHPSRLDSAVVASALRVTDDVAIASVAAPRLHRGPVVSVTGDRGSITVAGDPGAAASQAITDLVEARRRGVLAVLVAPTDEVEALSTATRAALRSAGVVGRHEHHGFSPGEAVWFTHAHPAAGVARHAVGVVHAVDDVLTVRLRDGRTQPVRPGPSLAHADVIPRLPGLVAQFDQALVLGAPIRARTPSHRYVTVAVGHDLRRLRTAAEDLGRSVDAPVLGRSLHRPLVLSR